MATLSVARIFTNSIFSAALSKVRTNSALRSLARKFALRFSAALGIARTSSALRSLARKFVRLVRPTRSPFYSLKEISVNSWNSWANKTNLFQNKTKPYISDGFEVQTIHSQPVWLQAVARISAGLKGLSGKKLRNAHARARRPWRQPKYPAKGFAVFSE